ncbi:MAG: hypothetical protein JSV52_14875 [Candidatus Zixiibacteriota bacterium]|nr:MAG: hypothetical protein JSV52_14875 [candidate division Zixibacteria bacterium]
MLKLIPYRILSAGLLLVVVLFMGCGDDSAGPGQPQIVGTLSAHSDCGGYVAAKTLADITSGQSAVAWAWDGQGTLDLRHLNGAFNCCPQMDCKITVKDNIITVTEMDEGLCDCLCLTDVDYRITGIPAGTYFVKFEEMNLVEGDEKLEFPVTLGSQAGNDTVVVQRDHYPWVPEDPLIGGTTEFSECGGFETARLLSEPPADSVCIAWEYDESHTLKLLHQNVTFNCGMYDIATMVVVDTGAIWIEERPLINPMHCDCLFDVEIEIPNLSPDFYMVVIMDSYWDGEKWVPSGDSLHFSIDLVQDPSGYHCYEEAEPQ